MKPGFVKDEERGMTFRVTKNGKTLYESVRITDPIVIERIIREMDATGLTATKVIATMLSRFCRVQENDQK